MSTLGFDPIPTIGALQIGVFFAVCLFGAVTVQVALYYTRFPSDPHVLKGLVVLVWFLDFGHTFAICDAMYIMTVVQYGHPELLEFVPDSLNAAILLSGLVGPLQQGWFAYRLYRFSHSCYLPLFCVFLSTCRAGGSFALGTIALRRMPVLLFVEQWGWLVAVLLIVGVVTDIILVFSLCFHLSAWRGDGFQRMNRLVNRLMQWSIETGLITSFGAVSLLICFVTMPDNFYWIAISVVLSKLYSNSLMFSLNTRKPELHIEPDFKRRESLQSLHSTDPLATEFKVEDVRTLSCPASVKWRSDRSSFSAVSLHNSYIFPPGEGMPPLAP
ncbi:hypothetical protein C8F04DRAFT_309753 [Mycena alexandri]|uniref:DUF6534 domain-containing protein n=1 Tax=Mycena alexandri TaxID=1745969 RepID=A0AAD6S6R0_9AGAR|nr:hypothetical protein C8F04DRAFT_309753 [Mycena alexandri]